MRHHLVRCFSLKITHPYGLNLSILYLGARYIPSGFQTLVGSMLFVAYISKYEMARVIFDNNNNNNNNINNNNNPSVVLYKCLTLLILLTVTYFRDSRKVYLKQ